MCFVACCVVIGSLFVLGLFACCLVELFAVFALVFEGLFGDWFIVGYLGVGWVCLWCYVVRTGRLCCCGFIAGAVVGWRFVGGCCLVVAVVLVVGCWIFCVGGFVWLRVLIRVGVAFLCGLVDVVVVWLIKLVAVLRVVVCYFVCLLGLYMFYCYSG